MPVQEGSRDTLDQRQLLQVLTAFEKGDFNRSHAGGAHRHGW